MMGFGPDWTGDGLGHWIVFIVTVVVIVYPLGRILGRIGLSPFWSILAFVPVVNLVALWVLAYTAWPKTSPGPT